MTDRDKRIELVDAVLARMDSDTRVKASPLAVYGIVMRFCEGKGALIWFNQTIYSDWIALIRERLQLASYFSEVVK